MSFAGSSNGSHHQNTQSIEFFSSDSLQRGLGFENSKSKKHKMMQFGTINKDDNDGSFLVVQDSPTNVFQLQAQQQLQQTQLQHQRGAGGDSIENNRDRGVWCSVSRQWLHFENPNKPRTHLSSVGTPVASSMQGIPGILGANTPATQISLAFQDTQVIQDGVIGNGMQGIAGVSGAQGVRRVPTSVTINNGTSLGTTQDGKEYTMMQQFWNDKDSYNKLNKMNNMNNGNNMNNISPIDVNDIKNMNNFRNSFSNINTNNNNNNSNIIINDHTTNNGINGNNLMINNNLSVSIKLLNGSKELFIYVSIVNHVTVGQLIRLVKQCTELSSNNILERSNNNNSNDAENFEQDKDCNNGEILFDQSFDKAVKKDSNLANPNLTNEYDCGSTRFGEMEISNFHNSSGSGQYLQRMDENRGIDEQSSETTQISSDQDTVVIENNRNNHNDNDNGNDENNDNIN